MQYGLYDPSSQSMQYVKVFLSEDVLRVKGECCGITRRAQESVGNNWGARKILVYSGLLVPSRCIPTCDPGLRPIEMVGDGPEVYCEWEEVIVVVCS